MPKGEFTIDSLIDFRVGDKVITAQGDIGRITSVRFWDGQGFPDIDVRWTDAHFRENNYEGYGANGTEVRAINLYDCENKYKDFYQIGNTVLGNIDLSSVEEARNEALSTLNKLQEKIKFLNKLKYEGDKKDG